MRKYLFYLLLSIFPVIGFGQILQQGFDDITTLAGSGWTMTNQSTTPGTTGWFQGNIDVFESHTGAPTSYIGANFNNTTGNSTISNWLITPTLNLKDGDQVSFYTRTTDMPASWADRLELRMSEGATFTSPSGPTGVGSFTALLHSVNPDLTTTGYPAEWTRIDVTISGLGATAVPVNLAFRYFVTNGGPSGSASNFIGIDSVLVEEGTSGGSDYCIPEGTNVNRYINNFSTTGGVDNITNMASGFSTGGYGDFTATHSVSQDPEGSVSFTADINGGIAGFRIWVDWNQDGVFDIVDEVAYNSTGYLSTQSGSFVVPADATPGETRMRVVSHWLSTTGLVDPCATGFTYGEFEDYTFVVNGTTTPDYCIPEGTNVARYINNFSTTGGVENISNMASGFSTGGYGDFTATHSLTQETGESVSFTADIMGGTAGFRIWVDWNQDGVFDIVDEVAYNSTGYLSTQSGSFVVPAGAMEGTTRMRVVSHWLSTTGLVDPCATGFAYGEFEDYTFNVTAGGGGPTDPVYCAPATTNVNWEWITNVNFAGIDNTTDGNVGLNDYTDQVAEVTADSVVPITVTIESDANDYIWVFIDWNQNGTLDDAGEVTVLATATNVSGPYTEDVIVPADALEGETRMRVMLRYSFDPIDPDPCTSYTFGEIEDYTVNVTAGGGGGTFPAPYCGPIEFGFDVEPITNVVVADISNTSDAALNGSPEHEDFTAIVGNMEQGGSYDIALEGNTNGSWTNRFVVFIDWNQNDILDDEGEVYEMDNTIAGSTGTDGQQALGTIEVPADAELGTTRMRVKKIFGTTDFLDPCLGAGFGQVEDYTINVTEGTTEPGDDCSQETPSNGFENGHGFIHTAHIAHDFSVDAETTFTVEQFTFNILQQNPTATVTLSFYEETGGAPGDFIATTPAIVPTSTTTVGTAFGFNVVSTVVDLPAGFEFEGGATGANYFVAVNISNPTDSYWESTSVMTTPNTGYWSPDGGVTWTALTGGPWDGVFEIAGTCEEGEEPEPGDGCFVTGTFDQWPSTTHVAQCIGTVEVITAAGWAGEFSKVQVTAGTEYIFASSVSTDFITIADEDEEITFATGTGSVTWTSPIDQVIRFYTHLNDECEIEEVSRTRSVQCGDIPPPPANDECADAIALSCGDSATGSTIAANNSGGNAAGDVFYTFTGTGTPEMVTVSLCGSSYDTYLRVFTDCTLGTEIAFNDDSCGLQSQLTFMSDGTSTYVIMVEGFSSNTGNYTIDITCAAPPEFTCEEQEVLSNGLENGLFFGGDTDQSLAVDVIVGDEGFIVYGSYVNVFVDGNTDLTFSVNFYDDAAGVPGALVHSSNAYFTENEFLGNAFGFDVYSYLVGFDDPFTAEANTTYWMEIVSDGLAWEATSASFLGSGLVFSNTNTGGAWTLDPATELVYDLICEPLGVSDMNSFDFTYYPNPVKDMLYIDAKQSIENVEVFNLAGQKVMADSKVSNGQINVNSLTPGTYVFRVTLDGGKVETFKIIKK